MVILPIYLKLLKVMTTTSFSWISFCTFMMFSLGFLFCTDQLSFHLVHWIIVLILHVYWRSKCKCIISIFWLKITLFGKGEDGYLLYTCSMWFFICRLYWYILLVWKFLMHLLIHHLASFWKIITDFIEDCLRHYFCRTVNTPFLRDINYRMK